MYDEFEKSISLSVGIFFFPHHMKTPAFWVHMIFLPLWIWPEVFQRMLSGFSFGTKI